jgi:hypothetical protein
MGLYGWSLWWCALSYNKDGDWFDDEDEEFVFTDSNKWFEDTLVAGLQERVDMEYGYLWATQRLLEAR